jgi:outer membrane protein
MKFSKTLVSLAAIAVTLLTSTSAIATQKGDWLVRARIIDIIPNVSSGEITDMSGTPVSPPSGIDVDSALTLDIDFSYFFTNNFAVELLLAIPATHDVTATGNLSSLGQIGEVTVLPPALIAQYHFMPNNNIRPYAGAGLGYIFFFDESTTSSLTNGLGASSTGLDVDNTADFLVQAGVDIDLKNNWFVNFDVKYFWINTTATIKADGADAAKVDFDLDPLVLGVGGGYRF